MKPWAAIVLLPLLVSAGPDLAAPNSPAKGAPDKSPGQPPANAEPQSQGHDEGTIEITADHDLELLQQDHAYVARGNAVAKRGAVTLTGDTLIAYYRPLAGPQKPAAATGKPNAASQQGLDTGNTEIWRVVAEGHVHIFSGERDAWGDRAEYDKDKSVIVLTGKALKASTFTDVVTARDTLEYWQDRDMAVARGDALIVRVNGNTLAGDVIAGNFVKDAQGQSALKTIAAKGHVVLTTLTDIVHGDEGTYDLDAKRTVLFGNVKATKGDSELEGQSAEVNMETGISQVFPGPGQRVRALIVRANAQNNSVASSAPAPAAKPPAAVQH
jgi:lipopolysaccharide export system protein LptA